MPTFKIEYGMDLPAYGETTIQAKSLDEAKAKARELHSKDLLISDWDAAQEYAMSENHRVVSVFRKTKDSWQLVSDGFALDEPEPESISTKAELWIAYDPAQQRIVGHTNSLAGVMGLRMAHPNARILSCN